MSAKNGSSMNHSGHAAFSGSRKSGCGKGNWSAVNIAAMVVGFVLFWPVGLAVLYWNIKGREVKDLPAAVKQKWSRHFGSAGQVDAPTSENVVFDEYQQTQYDRISEIKEEIKDRARHFKDFRNDAKRRADQDEFNSFMSSKPNGN